MVDLGIPGRASTEGLPGLCRCLAAKFGRANVLIDVEEVVRRTLAGILVAALLTGGCALGSDQPSPALETSALPTSTTAPDTAAKMAAPSPKQATTTPKQTAKPEWIGDRAAWCR